jgi:hypothetical protein
MEINHTIYPRMNLPSKGGRLSNFRPHYVWLHPFICLCLLYPTRGTNPVVAPTHRLDVVTCRHRLRRGSATPCRPSRPHRRLPCYCRLPTRPAVRTAPSLSPLIFTLQVPPLTSDAAVARTKYTVVRMPRLEPKEVWPQFRRSSRRRPPPPSQA